MSDAPQTGDAISPAKRKSLQKAFEHANKVMGQENYDYAAELLTQCVIGDPGNFAYVQTFLGNLKKKYSDKKGGKLAFFQGVGSKNLLKKASLQKDWHGVIKSGVELLKKNPWDVPTLTNMAAAADALGFDDVQLAYLKTALEADPKDPNVCRLCALALGERGEFDQAMNLWVRVQQARPDDEEAPREIGRLTVEKTIARGGYEDSERSKKAGKKGADFEEEEGQTPQQRMLREIKRHPEKLTTYIELANLYLGEKQYEQAEEILRKAHEVSGGDPEMLERLEDAQITGMRYRLTELRKRAEETKDKQLAAQHNQLLGKIKAKDLEIYKHRCERFPSNLAFRYELGRRLQQVGRHKEAIVEFQQAKNDPRFRGLCNLHLGQSFQEINQHRLALNHYESAVQDISDRNADDRKQALYLAGKLAVIMENLDAASRYLTALAEMDFSYKDVSSLLDEVDRKRDH